MAARTVVISGGGTGIGRASARRFAHTGDKVWLVGRRQAVLERAAKELTREGGEADFVAADAADPADVADLAGEIAGSDGTVEVLVNAAGGLAGGKDGTLTGLHRAWLEDLAGNLLTAVLLTEALRPHLSPGARVVTIGSIAGNRGAGSYGAAKAALVAWNASLASQLGPLPGTANVVVPGYVTDTEFFGDRMTQGRHDRLVTETLVGRAGRPDDVAGAVAFLASEDAAWITGQTLHVNGGALLAR